MGTHIKATIPTYEELTDSDGKIYTVYNVFVEEKKTSMRWLLRKRYSAFQALHAALKEQYPDVVEPFRFPHKSMFNTFSNYTKERRRQGFDDFLKILVTLEPFPPEVAKFLELDDHVWHEAMNIPKSTGAAVGDGRKEGNSIGGVQAVSDSSDLSEAPGSSDLANSGDIHKLTKKDVLTTLRTTFVATSTIYVVCITFGIIDTTTHTWSDMVLSLLLLGSIFTLVRVLLLKREYQHALSKANSAAKNK